MKIIRNCYSTQGKGYAINIQIRHTAILFWKTKQSQGKKLSIHLFARYNKFLFKLY